MVETAPQLRSNGCRKRMNLILLFELYLPCAEGSCFFEDSRMQKGIVVAIKSLYQCTCALYLSLTGHCFTSLRGGSPWNIHLPRRLRGGSERSLME